jgi:hypothetical protein
MNNRAKIDNGGGGENRITDSKWNRENRVRERGRNNGSVKMAGGNGKI